MGFDVVPPNTSRSTSQRLGLDVSRPWIPVIAIPGS
jgi:hypothetical protein